MKIKKKEDLAIELLYPEFEYLTTRLWLLIYSLIFNVSEVLRNEMVGWGLGKWEKLDLIDYHLKLINKHFKHLKSFMNMEETLFST